MIIVLSALFLVLLNSPQIIYWVIWPDCSYESSDGKWWDTEVQIKGRGVDDLVTIFELYKLRCDASAAKIVRVTRKNPLNIFAWRSYLTDEKWKIEYCAPSDKNVGNSAMDTYGNEFNGYPPCMSIPKLDRDQDLEMASEASRKFIESLSAVKQPPLFGK